LAIFGVLLDGATLTSAPANAQPPRLLDQVRSAARQHGHTEEVTSAIADWCERFTRFHGKRHPRELDIGAAGQFLEFVARKRSLASPQS
jgi:hypothetical protein